MASESFGTPEAARAISGEIIDLLQARFPTVHPMQITAAVAMALGGMVAALETSGATKPGRTTAILDHLHKMAGVVLAEALDGAA